MKWNSPEKVEGQTRKIVQFLLFPKIINGETRWLEKATIIQKLGYYASEGWIWMDVAWDEYDYIGLPPKKKHRFS